MATRGSSPCWSSPTCAGTAELDTGLIGAGRAHASLHVQACASPAQGPLPVAPTPQVVKEVINPQAPIVFRPNTADDPPRRKPDITLMRERFGWEPKVTLKDGLQRMVADFKARLHVT